MFVTSRDAPVRGEHRHEAAPTTGTTCIAIWEQLDESATGDPFK